MNIAQVCLRLATIKGHSERCLNENQPVSCVTTICLTQCNTSHSHQVVDCGLWNVDPLLFNGWSQTLVSVVMSKLFGYANLLLQQLSGWMV